jgi:hypothetical protein
MLIDRTPVNSREEWIPVYATQHEQPKVGQAEVNALECKFEGSGIEVTFHQLLRVELNFTCGIVVLARNVE